MVVVVVWIDTPFASVNCHTIQVTYKIVIVGLLRWHDLVIDISSWVDHSYNQRGTVHVHRETIYRTGAFSAQSFPKGEYWVEYEGKTEYFLWADGRIERTLGKASFVDFNYWNW